MNTISFNNNTLSITSSRITSMLNKIEFLTNKICISARELSEFAGKIIFTKFIIGNTTHLKTRDIYKIIENRPSWDNKFNLSLHEETIKGYHILKKQQKSREIIQNTIMISLF